MKNNWAIICFTYAGLLTLGLMENSRGPYYLQMMNDFKLNNLQGSLVFIGPAITGAIFSFYSVRMIRSFPDMMLFRLGLLLMGAGYYLISMAEDLLLLTLGGGITGAGVGLLGVIQNVMIEKNSTPKLRGRLYAGLHSNYALASLAAPLCINLVIQWGWTWRAFFACCSAGTVLLTTASCCIRSNPRPKTIAPLKAVRPDKFKPVLIVAITMACYVLAEISISTRLVLYSQQTEALDIVNANFRLALFFTLLLFGRMLFTFLPVPSRYVHTFIMTNMALSLITYLAGLLFASSWLIACTGLFMSAIFPVLLEYISLLFKKYFSYAISMAMALTSASMALMHFGIGALSDLYGIRAALFVGPSLLLLALIFCFWSRQQEKKSTPFEGETPPKFRPSESLNPPGL